MSSTENNKENIMSNPFDDYLKKGQEEIKEYTEEVKKALRFDINPHIISLIIGDKSEPFFAYWSRRTTKVKTLTLPTAGVTAKDGDLVLYWNPLFLSKLSNDEIRGLLKHEFYHLIFNHLTSRRREPAKVWNVAADCAINSLIAEGELPKCGVIPGFVPLDKEGKEIDSPLAKLVKTFPKEKASEWYFSEILKNDEVVEYIEGPDCQEGFDEHIWGDLSPEDKEMLKEKLRAMLREAIREADSSNEWGSISSSIREMLRELISNQVDWKTLLRQIIGMAVSFRKSGSLKVINKRYPYIHPGKKKTRQAKVRVYIDQSGSVSNSDIELFFGELKNLARKSEFECFFFDHEVDQKSKFVWRRNRKMPTLRTKCGGTNFDAVVQHFNEDVRHGQTDASLLLILTDGECSQPRPCVKKMAYVIAPNRKLLFAPRETEMVVTMKTPANVAFATA